MSTLQNMQLLTAASKPLLLGAMKRLETMLPKLGVMHYSLQTGDRELKVQILAGTTRPVEVSHFSLSFLPGCREVMVLHGVTVAPELRHLGVGSLLHQLRLDMARAVGARHVLCTVLSGNTPEKAIIRKAGWRVAVEVNPQVEMWSREL